MFKEELEKIQTHIKEAVGRSDTGNRADNMQSEHSGVPEETGYQSVLNLLDDLSSLTAECLAHFDIIDEIKERVDRIGDKSRSLTETLSHTREVVSRLERSRDIPQPVEKLTSNPEDMSKGRDDESQTDYLHTYLNRVEHADMPQPVMVEKKWRELRDGKDEAIVEVDSVSDEDIHAAGETMEDGHVVEEKTVSQAVEDNIDQLPAGQGLETDDDGGESGDFFKADFPGEASGVEIRQPELVQINQGQVVERYEVRDTGQSADNPGIDECLEIDSQVERIFEPEVKAIDKMLGDYKLSLKHTEGAGGQQEPDQPEPGEGQDESSHVSMPVEEESESAMSMLRELGDWEQVLGSCAKARQAAFDGLISNLTQRTEIIESQAPEGGSSPKAKAPADPLRAMQSKTVHTTCLGGHGYKKFSDVLDDLHGKLDIDKPKDESRDDLLKELEALEPESIFVGNQLLDELDKIEDKYF